MNKFFIQVNFLDTRAPQRPARSVLSKYSTKRNLVYLLADAKKINSIRDIIKTKLENIRRNFRLVLLYLKIKFRGRTSFLAGRKRVFFKICF